MENAGKVKKFEMKFNKFINKLFDNAEVKQSEITDVLNVGYDA